MMSLAIEIVNIDGHIITPLYWLAIDSIDIARYFRISHPFEIRMITSQIEYHEERAADEDNVSEELHCHDLAHNSITEQRQE
jgi:hypothetical protein